jgi:hypothetical protein
MFNVFSKVWEGESKYFALNVMNKLC